MARMPIATDDTGPDTMGDPDAGGMPDEAGTTDETVLITVTKKTDGTYMVYHGDEPEPGGEQTNGDVEGAAAGASIGDAESPVDGLTAPQGPQGEACADVPRAAAAVVRILHDDEGGEGGAEGDFQSGFGGGTSPPPLAQKY